MSQVCYLSKEHTGQSGRVYYTVAWIINDYKVSIKEYMAGNLPSSLSTYLQNASMSTDGASLSFTEDPGDKWLLIARNDRELVLTRDGKVRIVQVDAEISDDIYAGSYRIANYQKPISVKSASSDTPIRLDISITPEGVIDGSEYFNLAEWGRYEYATLAKHTLPDSTYYIMFHPSGVLGCVNYSLKTLGVEGNFQYVDKAGSITDISYVSCKELRKCISEIALVISAGGISTNLTEDTLAKFHLPVLPILQMDIEFLAEATNIRLNTVNTGAVDAFRDVYHRMAELVTLAYLVNVPAESHKGTQVEVVDPRGMPAYLKFVSPVLEAIPALLGTQLGPALNGHTKKDFLQSFIPFPSTTISPAKLWAWRQKNWRPAQHEKVG